MVEVFEKIIKFSLYSLVFLLPLFWLPFSFEAYEFNKIYLLYFFVSISFLAWLAKAILVEKEIRIKKSPLDIPILVFLFFAILSSIFSVDKNSSLFGFYGRFSNGLIPLLSFVLFYFLITNNVSPSGKTRIYTDEKQINADEKIGINQPKSVSISVSGLIKTLLFSVFLVILITYLSIFGVWKKIPRVPQIMTQKTFNPVSGSLEGLSVFLSIFLVFLVSRILVGIKGKVTLATNYLLLILTLGILSIVDFNPSWLVLILSFSFLLIFALAKRTFEEKVNKLLLPIILILISIFFLSFNFKQSIGFSLPVEQILNLKTSFKVAFSGAVENWKSGFFGSGLGTWSYEFSKFKPVDFNKTIFWQIRYDRPGSHFSEILGTMGFFGFFSYLFLVGLFFLISWFLAKKIEFLPFFFTFLAIFFSQIFYYQNISLAFLFWLFLGLTISSSKSLKEKSFSFKDLPELSLVFSTIFILLFFLILTTYFFAFRFYLADQNYSRAQFVSSTQDKIRLLEKAVNLNQRLINYRLILARTYLLQIFEETAKPLAEQDSNKIQNSMARAIDQAKRATEISPNSVLGWETLGMIYRDIQPLAAGATDWAIKSFEKAIKLEPKNPVLYTELGKIYLATDLQKSKEYFSKAKELKPDYLDALIQDALVFEREKNLDEAIKRMEEVVKSYPFSIEARFQLGRLYFNSGKLDEAISQFEQVISIFPNHSNSLYSLGLAYAKKGEKEKAISYLEKVLKLNPGNKEIIQKLEELKK